MSNAAKYIRTELDALQRRAGPDLRYSTCLVTSTHVAHALGVLAAVELNAAMDQGGG